MRNRTTNQIELILIRHGATASNERGSYLGKTEEPLSENGLLNLMKKKENGSYPPAELVAASPMKRCVQTAELIYGRVPAVLVEEWKEIDFGRFEGKTWRELEGDPDYQKWIDSGGTLPFPNGESRDVFIERCTDGFTHFCKGLLGRRPLPEAVALIVHGGTIMALLSSFSAGDYYSYQCKCAEGYRCELDLKDQIRLRGIRKLGI